MDTNQEFSEDFLDLLDALTKALSNGVYDIYKQLTELMKKSKNGTFDDPNDAELFRNLTKELKYRLPGFMELIQYLIKGGYIDARALDAAINNIPKSRED